MLLSEYDSVFFILTLVAGVSMGDTLPGRCVCHTHPRYGGEYGKYTVLLTPATRVSMTVYFSYSLRSINQVEALEHHSAYEYINYLNSIEHQPGYCCLEHHSAYNWL